MSSHLCGLFVYFIQGKQCSAQFILSSSNSMKLIQILLKFQNFPAISVDLCMRLKKN